MNTARHTMLCAIVVLTFGAMKGYAQDPDIDIQGTLRFSSTEVTGVSELVYGAGTLYTDSTDREYEDMIPPFPPPPPGFLIAFDRACSKGDGDPPCFWKQDLRGIPDSVTAGGRTRFELRYTILIFNQTNSGFRLAILNPDWPAGVDSIKIVDRILPRAFTHVFTGPAVTMIEDPETSQLDVTVYYNLRTLSIDDEREANGMLTLAPNPLRDENLSLRGRFAGNDRIVLVDALGRTVEEMTIVEESTILTWNTLNIPSGIYYVLHFNEKSVLRGRRMLNVVR